MITSNLTIFCRFHIAASGTDKVAKLLLSAGHGEAFLF